MHNGGGPNKVQRHERASPPHCGTGRGSVSTRIGGALQKARVSARLTVQQLNTQIPVGPYDVEPLEDSVIRPHNPHEILTILNTQPASQTKIRRKQTGDPMREACWLLWLWAPGRMRARAVTAAGTVMFSFSRAQWKPSAVRQGAQPSGIKRSEDSLALDHVSPHFPLPTFLISPAQHPRTVLRDSIELSPFTGA